MPLMPTSSSDTMSVGFGSDLPKIRKFLGGIKIGSCMHNNWVYHVWEGHPGDIKIKVHLFPIALANTFPSRANDGKLYAFRFVQFI